MKPNWNNTTQSPTEFIETFQNWRDEIFNYETAVSEIASTMKMTLLINNIQGDIKSYLLLNVNLAKADFEDAATKVEDYYTNVYIDNINGGGIQALGKPKKPKDYWKGGKGKDYNQPYKPWKGKGKGGKYGKPYYQKGKGNYDYQNYTQPKGSYYNYKKSEGKGKGDTAKGPPLPSTLFGQDMHYGQFKTIWMTKDDMQKHKKRDDDKIEKEGYYVAPLIPNYEQYREQDERRLQEEEWRQQEAELELQRQAAQQETPPERTVQVQEVRVEVPDIPAEATAEAAAVSVRSSSTSGQTSSRSSHTERLQMIDNEDEHYWANIIDYMCNAYTDEDLEEGTTTADELHEGVLYWMDKKDIENLMAQSRQGDKDAEKRMENYYTDMKRLEITLRLEYEENNSRIEDKEEFITALETKDDKTLKPMLF
eukprot:2290977-Amphidinium_carterae.1